MWHHATLQHGGFYSNSNQYSFMQTYFYVIGRNGLSMNFSIRGSSAWLPTAYAHGAHDCPGYPGQSAQSYVMLEGSVTSVHPLYNVAFNFISNTYFWSCNKNMDFPKRVTLLRTCHILSFISVVSYQEFPDPSADPYLVDVDALFQRSPTDLHRGYI